MKQIRYISILLIAILLVAAPLKAALVSVDSSTNVEGQNIIFKGPGIHTLSNPAKISVANEDNVEYTNLEIVSRKPNKVVAKLPYVDSLRYLILHYSGGTVTDADPQLIPIVIFNSPNILDEENGDPGQAGTGSISFTGPQGPKGDAGEEGEQGPTGSQGPVGVPGSSILTSNNIFSGVNTFSSTHAVTGDSTFSGDVVFSGRINGTSPIVLEGSNANTNGTTLSITGPTAARTITIPDTSGTFAVRDITKEIGIINAGTAWAIYPESGAYDVITTNVDAAGRVITTLTNGITGGILMLKFSFTSGSDVTVTDTDAGGANTIDLVGTGADATIDTNGDVLILMHTGSRWVEIGKSITP